MPNSFGPIVSAEWLADELDKRDVKVVDLRWYLGDSGKGRKEYESGHIPGAVFVDLDVDISAPTGAGRHPIPSKEQFEEAMRTAGVNKGDQVVAYDDANGSVAGRLWWLLKVHGHENAAVLDGGLQAWKGSLEESAPSVTAGNFEASEPDFSGTLTYEDMRGVDTKKTIVLDARAPERYLGETEPVDPIAGHIPGAKNAEWQGNLGPDGKFLPPEELRRRYSELGVEPGNTVAYCGSGVTSCHDLIAIELAGLGPAKLYAGSWSDWSNRPDAPVATGPE
jgi:thiosulfate/3-mercaptopyruvate sulfurtransferase